MKYFAVGQKWLGNYGIFGSFFGEVIEISGMGQYGVIVITDECGNELDEYTGSASDFQSSGEWQLADRLPSAKRTPIHDVEPISVQRDFEEKN